MRAPDVAALLSRLEAAGAHVQAVGGDGLALTGRRPPADLLTALRDRRADVLAFLTAKEDSPPPSPSPGGVQTADALREEGAKGTHNLRPLPPGPDWDTLAAQPGHCGSCARAVDVSDVWGPLMVACTCDPVAWWPLPPPFALHVGARCGAYQREGEEVGRGWRAKDSGKRWGLSGPLSPVPWEALPTLEGGAA